MDKYPINNLRVANVSLSILITIYLNNNTYYTKFRGILTLLNCETKYKGIIQFSIIH